MPDVSDKQRRAMYAAQEGKSTLSIPPSVGREFVAADKAVGNPTLPKTAKKRKPKVLGDEFA